MMRRIDTAIAALLIASLLGGCARTAEQHHPTCSTPVRQPGDADGDSDGVPASQRETR